MDLTEPLAEFVAGFSLESLPRDALCFADEHVTDAVGIGLAPKMGSHASGMSHTYQPAVFAGALAAGRLLGYSPGQLVNVLGHARGMVSGNQQP